MHIALGMRTEQTSMASPYRFRFVSFPVSHSGFHPTVPGPSLASQPPFTHAERRDLVECVKDPCRRGMHDVTYFWCA